MPVRAHEVLSCFLTVGGEPAQDQSARVKEFMLCLNARQAVYPHETFMPKAKATQAFALPSFDRAA